MSEYKVCWFAGLVLFLTLSCQGPTGKQGEPGKDGAPGSPGVSCWDLNQNGVCDMELEDTNGDGRCDSLDCRGKDGQAGTPGKDGSAGISCWDLNQNGVCDPSLEDVNGDGICDTWDCKGKDGEPGQIVVPEIPPDLQNMSLIAFHASINDQTPDSLCRTCHGTMRNLYSLDPSIKQFHARKFEILGDTQCTFCHGSVDLLEKSGATLRKQVDVKGRCAPCHTEGSGFKTFYMGQ